MNSGNRNSGDWNSGNMNSGDRNSGNWNSGDRNSGNWNSGNGVLNSFCTKRSYILFDKPCTEKEYQKAQDLHYKIPFELIEWIDSGKMTQEEKDKNPSYKVTDGYLKVYEYKEAWKNALEKTDKETKKKIKKLKNFSARKFKEITGCKI